MRTRLTEILGVEHPVMLAGMGGVSYSALVAAVSDAGGFGCLGASTMSPDTMVGEMAAVRGITDRPFGVDLLTAMPGDLVAQVELVVEGGATVFVAGLGVPAAVVELCHAHRVLVVNMCGKVDHARRALDAGCDVVVAQGTEAGGHTGTVATMPLVPQIVDAVGDRIPVVAAGGIVDGRGLAAAVALGADGVWIGTRFIATPEARGVTGYKDALLGARETRPRSAGPTRARPCGSCATGTPATSTSTPTSWLPFRNNSDAQWGTAPSTSVAGRTPRASTPSASATRPDRGWARCGPWSPRASWSPASSTRPSR